MFYLQSALLCLNSIVRRHSTRNLIYLGTSDMPGSCYSSGCLQQSHVCLAHAVSVEGLPQQHRFISLRGESHWYLQPLCVFTV